MLAALALYSIISAFTLGYIMANERTRHRGTSTIPVLLKTVSILVALDLDNSVSGGIRLSAEPVLAARQVLNTKFQAAVPQEALYNEKAARYQGCAPRFRL